MDCSVEILMVYFILRMVSDCSGGHLVFERHRPRKHSLRTEFHAFPTSHPVHVSGHVAGSRRSVGNLGLPHSE